MFLTFSKHFIYIPPLTLIPKDKCVQENMPLPLTLCSMCPCPCVQMKFYSFFRSQLKTNFWEVDP